MGGTQHTTTAVLLSLFRNQFLTLARGARRHRWHNALLELDELVVIVHVHDPANKGHSRKGCLLSVVEGEKF